MLDFDADPGAATRPVHALSADIGLGKTRKWREHVAAIFLAAGRTPVLAVPRHRLGDEIVGDLASAGISAQVYRGREAIDPEQPDEKMCRDLGRINLITEALGSVSARACQRRDKQCEFFDACGYQQQRLQRPDLWIVAHQCLFRAKPSFIPRPDALAIDESFWSASLHGFDRPVRLWIRKLIEDRDIPRDVPATADLIAISRDVHVALKREGTGRIRRAALAEAGIALGDLRTALELEWRRKIELDDVHPGMPLAAVREICGAVAVHNQDVARLVRFWKLLIRTLGGPDERSPWLELRIDEPLPKGGGVESAVCMTWRDDIHPDWCVPTIVMDATMPVEIVRQFFPKLTEHRHISALTSHARVRQLTDRPMTADMLIPTDGAGERTNATRRANVERVRRYIEVRANEVCPGQVLVVCQLGLEIALGALPANVEIRHFNDIAGENAWSSVALVIVIGRTEPAPRTIERTARALFGADVIEIDPDEMGGVRYPHVTRGVRMRDGSGIAVEGPMHPDPRAEAVRWAVCEAGVVQAIGRGRAVNRLAANSLEIDVITNVVLPIVVDELTTWEGIQPRLAEIMRARRAVPVSYADMAAAYPDLFSSRDAARMALTRENPEQMPIAKYLIGVCSGFSSLRYRRAGARGPATLLLYDTRLDDPLSWLAVRIGEVSLVGGPDQRTGHGGTKKPGG